MKTILKLFTLSCAIIIAAGCNKEESLVNNDQTKILKSGNAGVIESITGSGQFTRDDYYEPDVWRTFTINAVKKTDGTVNGHFQLNNHNLTKMAGKVLCFTVVGNHATVVVKWERYDSSVADPVSDFGYVFLEDNGEGQKGTPDQISLMPWITNPEYYCGKLISYPLNPIEAGNIQIH